MAARLYSLPPLLNPSSARSPKFIVIVSKQTVLLFETVQPVFLSRATSDSAINLRSRETQYIISTIISYLIIATNIRSFYFASRSEPNGILQHIGS